MRTDTSQGIIISHISAVQVLEFDFQVHEHAEQELAQHLHGIKSVAAISLRILFRQQRRAAKLVIEWALVALSDTVRRTEPGTMTNCKSVYHTVVPQ